MRSGWPPSAQWETDLPTPGPVIVADARQIRQVLTHLVDNAREAADASAVVRVRVTTVNAADMPDLRRFPVDGDVHDAAYACLEVADTGCGIPEQDLDNIFDPFFSTRFPGRGMGLAVVLGIVRERDGWVTVESQPGRGSVFRVFLPLAGNAGSTVVARS